MPLFYLLIFVMPLVRHPLWSRFVGTLTVIKIVGAACFLYAIASSSARSRLIDRSPAVWFTILASLCSLSYLGHGRFGDWATSPLMSYVSFAILLSTTLMIVDSLERLRGVMLATIGAVAFASLYVLREWQQYRDVFLEFRPGWVTGDPNYFTISALLAMPFAFFLLREHQPKWERWYCLGCSALTLFAVTLAASRGGFLGLAAGMLLIVWRAQRRVTMLLAISVLLFGLSLVSPASPIERLTHPSKSDDESTDKREALWRAGIAMAAANPILGVGVGRFKSNVPIYSKGYDPNLDHIAHNTYIEFAAEVGFPGLIAFLGVLIGSLRSAGRIRQRCTAAGPPELRAAASGIEVGLVSFAVAAFFVSAEYQKYFWLIVFLGLCLPALADAAAPLDVDEPENTLIPGLHGHPHPRGFAVKGIGCFLVAVALPAAGLFAASTADAETTDRYGGDGGLPVAGGATGYFRLGRMGDQWVFATPDGNAFWLRAVYNIYPLATKIPGKYPSKAVWAAQVVKRLRSWGFNAIGEYSMANVLPVRTYGSTGANPEQMPFIRMIRPADASLTNRWKWAAGPVKDLVEGLDPSVYGGAWAWRGGSLPDLFDPNFEATVRGYAADRQTAAWTPIFWHKNTPAGLSREPWLLGTATDDADSLWGFKRTTDPNLGWMVAVTRPQRNESAKHHVHYDDPVVYSKLALRDFLRERYDSIEALNHAWGASYTTFDSDGGWPDGHGLLDENGRHPWMATNAQFSRLQQPRAQEDLNGFMERFAERYFSLVSEALRAATPHHLVFGPSALHDPKDEVLRAAARHLDALQIHISPDRLSEMESGFLQHTYASFPKPIFVWTTLTSQHDSPLARCATAWGQFDRPTQEARGQGYADYLQRLLRFRTSDGIGPVVGIDWWSWSDKTSGGECANFGLVTVRDNAYDGREAAVEAGLDPFGFPTGGETARYGNFLGSVRSSHDAVHSWLEKASGRPGTAGLPAAP